MNRALKTVGFVATALLVSVAFGWALGVGLGNRSAVSAQGASSGNLMAVPGTDNRLYLIDTEAKVIVVYDSQGRSASGFTCVAARSYEVDIEASKRTEIRFSSKGYNILQMQALFQKNKKRLLQRR